MTPYGFAPLSQTLPYWPADVFGQPEFLDEIGVRDFEVQEADDQLGMTGTLIWVREISLDLPLVKGFSVALLSANGYTAVPFEVDILPEFVIRIPDISIAFRLDTKLLRPVVREKQKWVPIKDTDGKPKPAELRFTGVGVQVDLDGNLELLMPAGAPLGNLGAVQIGDTGIVVELEGLAPYFSVKQTPPAGAPPGFRGVKIDSLKIYLPDDFNIPAAPDNLHAENLMLGTGGFSGTIGAGWTANFANGAYSGSGGGTLFGIPFGLKSLDVTFKQNIPTAFAIKGEMLLPFFEHPVKVTIGIDSTGGFAVSLDSATANGLYKLTKKDVLELELDSLGFEVKDGIFTAKLSGQLTPLFGKDQGLVWPGFQVNELSIDSKGHVRLDGGWLDLRDQYHLNFHGFKIEVTKLGFGKTDDGGKWVGFSGGLKLVDGFPAGASVEGLRITWYEDDPSKTKITLNGAGVEFLVPDVLYFKGDVSYRTLDINGETVHRFDGDITLGLPSLDMKVEATLVIGSASGPQGDYTFLAIYLDAELPEGIPLFSTDLALYGISGLFALQMEPDKHADEEWYEGWYKRGQVGVTDIKQKWINRQDSLALGAGAVIGTWSDDGFLFSAGVLLVIVFPGPIILIEGKANLLKERATLDSEPNFRALAVLDNRAGKFMFGLDAQYKYESGGELIDITGGAEAFFDFHDATAWHIYVGENKPSNKRIRAELFEHLLEANSYFMLDARQLATGAWLGYSRGWDVGPLRIALEAWIEGNAVISTKPSHFYGDLWLHGRAELSAFGFGLGLNVDAQFAADVFDPFHVVASFSVGIKLPRPFKKKSISADITLEWGPDHKPPPLPLPLKEIAIGHFKVTTSWPLARNQQLLLPNYDADGDGFLQSPTPSVSAQETAPPPSNAPIVPLDCRPQIVFGRTVHDDALIGVNPQPVSPAWEQIGDPQKNQGPVSVRYALSEVALYRWSGTGWQLIARKGVNANPEGVRTLFGSWAPVPQLPSGNVTPGTDPPVSNSKLWLWSKTPFDYTRHNGSGWDDWFTNHFNHYPCVPSPPERDICCDFELVDRTQQLQSPWQCSDHPEISVEWDTFDVGSDGEVTFTRQTVSILSQPIKNLTHALCFHRLEDSSSQSSTMVTGSGFAIRLSQPASKVTLVVAQEHVNATTFIRFRDFQPGGGLPDSGPTPLIEKGARFEVRDAKGLPLSRWRIGFPETPQGSIAGLKCEGELDIILPCASSFAQLILTRSATSTIDVDIESKRTLPPGSIVAAPVTIQAFEEDGSAGDVISLQSPARVLETIRITGRAITRVVIRTPAKERPGRSVIDLSRRREPAAGQSEDDSADTGTFVHELCFDCAGASNISATGFGDNNKTYGPFSAGDNVLEVTGEDMKLIHVRSRGEICILQICATLGPDADELAACEAMSQHLVDEMTRWSQQGEVLEPNNDYRLKVVTKVETQGMLTSTQEQTEFAYFRTEGPPGLTALSAPIGQSNPSQFDSGLNDLTRYVRQTTPATVPSIGEKPRLPKPFYRAYNVGVEFNEDYVDLMYRMDGRDLGLYLYDNNDRPVRDAEGRLIVISNSWGETGDVTLTESEQRWINLINDTHCDPPASIDVKPAIDVTSIPHDKMLTSAAEGRVLDPDTVYEARLVPLLLHDSFTDYSVGASAEGPVGGLGPWSVFDSGSNEGPSHWEVREEGTPPSRYIIQTSNIWGGTNDGTDPVKPGTVLFRADYHDLPTEHPDQPSNWTDYRLSAYLRSATDGAIGVVFRYLDADHHYRFSMDRQGQYRRVVSVVNGEHTILREDDFVYDQNRDYLVTVEAIGSLLRVYQDGALVFDLSDLSIDHGSIGLYCWDNTGARFTDVRVDDFRKQVPAVYRFKFTTSRFTNFFHHLHSFQDEKWTVELGSVAGVQSLAAQAVPPATPPSESEARAYDGLAELVLGPSARQNPLQVEVTRVEHSGEALALLVLSPEPIDWKRTALEVGRAPRGVPKPKLPVAVKLTDVTLGISQPNEESVTLLLREATDLTGHRIEYLSLPGVVEPIGDDQSVLLRDRFTDGDTTAWAILDEGTDQGPSSWSTFEGALRQMSNINTPSPTPVLSSKGTHAVAGDPAWTDIIMSTLLHSSDKGALGLLFRYKDTDYYYRFSMDSQQAYRRLVKNVGGTFTLLWEDDFAYEVGRAYKVTIVTIGSTLRGYLDGARMFEIEDTDMAAGQVGLYCFMNTGARFSEVRVAAPVWTAYYIFEKESRMPAGTRVRVYAGNEADAPAKEQGVVCRFIASGADHGQLRLPSDGAGLRLRASDGAEGHARRFSPDADYVPVAGTKVLRKADGTGFFVIVPSATQAGSALAVGQYRLRMTYRRDNQAIDPGSQLLGEAANKSDERVTLDIPWQTG